ncbi:MAG: AAA family ATPase [Atopobium sp.]|nr:AAA family ATPase [Atopobium sp.]
MITKFSVSGYRCFNDQITFDFTKSKDYKFNDSCIKNGIITKAMVYGNNGSGKSNLGFAMFDIVGTLTDKNFFAPSADNYICRDSIRKFAEFNYSFQFGSDHIEYCYRKTGPLSLTYELVSINGIKLFEYDYCLGHGDFHLESIQAGTLNLEHFEPRMSVLKYIINNTRLSAKAPLKLLMNEVNGMLWFRSVFGNNYSGLRNDVDDIYRKIIENSKVKDLEHFLKENEIDLSLSSERDSSGQPVIIVNYAHGKALMSDVISSGTQALILFFYWSMSFNEVSFLFIDEFDAFYHYEVAENIVKMLRSRKNFQVVLTSHNTSLISNHLLRPDCYYILNHGKLVQLCNATRRELRQAHNLEKMYLSGEFDEA